VVQEGVGAEVVRIVRALGGRAIQVGHFLLWVSIDEHHHVQALADCQLATYGMHGRGCCSS
jgi:hypothetical protein